MGSSTELGLGVQLNAQVPQGVIPSRALALNSVSPDDVDRSAAQDLTQEGFTTSPPRAPDTGIQSPLLRQQTIRLVERTPSPHVKRAQIITGILSGLLVIGGGSILVANFVDSDADRHNPGHPLNILSFTTGALGAVGVGIAIALPDIIKLRNPK